MRIDYFKRIRKGERIEPKTSFEENYFLCYLFKKTYKNKLCKEILEKLIELSKIKLIKNSQSYEKRREKSHKTNKWCFCCHHPSKYQHHIILLKNGGFDSGINRIPICETCHKVIHPWL